MQHFLIPSIHYKSPLSLISLDAATVDSPHHNLPYYHFVQWLFVNLDHKNQLTIHCGVHKDVAVVVVYLATKSLEIQSIYYRLQRANKLLTSVKLNELLEVYVF